jgi:hypothetical protein
MRLSCAVTDLAGDFERALPKFQGLAIPAPLHRQQGSSTVRHRQIGAAWQRLEQADGTGGAVIDGLRVASHVDLYAVVAAQIAATIEV